MSDERFFSRDYIEFLRFSFIPVFGNIYIAGSYLTFIGLFIWAAIYYWLTVRKKVFKIFTAIILPLILTYLLFYNFYFLGGIGRVSEENLIAQRGVDIFYRAENFPKKDYFHHRYWVSDGIRSPRTIYVDREKKAVFANYASTYGRSSARRTPRLLKVDLETRNTLYFVSNFARTFAATPETIIIAPWFNSNMYELDKRDLSIIRKLPIPKEEEGKWEVLSILYENNNIYISTDMDAALYRFNYVTGDLEAVFRPNMEYGGGLWNITYSKERGNIYITGLGGEYNIYELDALTLELKKGVHLGLAGATALCLDDINGIIYLQDGDSSRLYEVYVEDFSLKRVLGGEVFSRKMYLDKKRNILYLLNYFFGTLTAMDLESGKKIWQVRVGGKSYDMDVLSGIAYINSMAGIIVVDLNKINLGLE